MLVLIGTGTFIFFILGAKWNPQTIWMIKLAVLFVGIYVLLSLIPDDVSNKPLSTKILIYSLQALVALGFAVFFLMCVFEASTF